MKKGARRSERLNVPVPEYDYIFFSEHALLAASHTPPAFSQSAWVFAVVTSPAKAGPVTATARTPAEASALRSPATQMELISLHFLAASSHVPPALSHASFWRPFSSW